MRHKIPQLVLHIVGADRHGDLAELHVIRHCHHICFAQFDETSAVVADNGPFGAVEDGTHGVGAFDADGDKDLADHVVGELCHGETAVVVWPIRQELVVHVGKDFFRIARQPAEQVQCMTAAAQEALTPDLFAAAPVFPAGTDGVIVGIFAFHSDQFPDPAGIQQHFCRLETGRIAADLTRHEIFSAFFDGAGDLLTFLHRGGKGLFAGNMLARHQSADRLFRVEMVRGRHNDDIHVGRIHFFFALRQRDIAFQIVLSLHAVVHAECRIIDQRQLRIGQVIRRLCPRFPHTETENCNLEFFCHDSSPSC